MSIQPIITFKAGMCHADTSTKPAKVRPEATPGYIYLYSEDDLVHFCWRARSTPLASPELDLMMVPTDGSFQPFLAPGTATPATDGAKSPLPGRVFTLKFSSSGERHFFWLQSREQPAGEKNRFSTRDLRLGEIVDDLLQGGDGLHSGEIEQLRGGRGGGGDGDGDTAMEDVSRSLSGGAGADATGGDVREEGEEAREGGADGGRAHTTTHATLARDAADDASRNAALRQLLASIGTSSSSSSTANRARAQAQAQDDSFTSLPDLLPSPLTTEILAKLPEPRLDALLEAHVPRGLLSLASSSSSTTTVTTLPLAEKRTLLAKILRSPQFAQAAAGVDRALRSGGLASVSEALGVSLDGERREEGAVGGGAAVKVFMEGVKREVEREEEEGKKEG